MCLALFPIHGYSQQRSSHPVAQNPVVETRLTMPRAVTYALRKTPFHKKLLADRRDLISPQGKPGRNDAYLASADRASSFKAMPMSEFHLKQSDILPGLPSALIAVVENSPAEQAVVSQSAGSSISEKHPDVVPIPLQSSSPGPVSLTATAFNKSDSGDRGLFLPFEAGVGAAAFMRGGDLLVIFDVARPFDLSMVQDEPIAVRSSIQLLPEATILRLPAHHVGIVTLRRLPAGWLIQTAGSGRTDKMITPVLDGALLRLPVENPGRTVIVPDPETGGNLLVGTLQSGSDAVDVRRYGSAAIIEQTVQGVVINPLSDQLELRPSRHAFLLSGMSPEALRPEGLPAGPEAGSRIMCLAPGSMDVLSRRFKMAKAAAAAAPANSRFAPRLLAAQDALALGDGRQAATIVHVAVADDAREAATHVARLVTAAAELLDRHADMVDLLDDPQNSKVGEIGLWRAVKLAERKPTSPEAARLFASNLSLLQSYPAPMQAVLLPLAGETLVRGGTDAQAAMLDHLPPGEALIFARALLAQRRGQTQAALAALDHAAAGRNLRLADQAAEEAVSIRRSLPAADPQKLADILEAHLLDARITGHDSESRLALAGLRVQGGQWQKALNLFREIATLYPEQAAEVRRQAGQVLKDLATIPMPVKDDIALEQASMIEANADMLPDGADGSRISLFLAARLSALDLPERAAPIVREMMNKAAPGADKAELGLQLAALKFQENDLAGVQTALKESDPGDLPQERDAPRLIMMARALAGGGQLDQALVTIATLKTAAALDLRASLMARHGDWNGATDTLIALARQNQPSAGKSDGSGQDLLIRLASAASRTGDKTRIRQVKAVGDGRFSDPGKAALFDLLTSDLVADDSHSTGASSQAASLRHTSAILESIAK